MRAVAATGDEASFGDAAALSPDLIAALNRSSDETLTFLASSACPAASLPAPARFWRDWALRYFTALRRHTSGDHQQWTSPDVPDEDTLRQIRESAPPMIGLEYVTDEMLRQSWRSLDQHVQRQAGRRGGGLAAMLRRLNEDWNLLGRVTFHLAENKRNPDKPFAFLATFTSSDSADGKPRHVPLSEALKASIASGDSKQLETLLAPVSRAATSSPLIAELLESKSLFTPQAWGIGRAYEFFRCVPQLEDAGLVVRIPDWWNASKPPRPQVNLRIGSKTQSTLGGDALDLSIDVAIDGDPLTDAELQQLLAAREGMTLLRGKWVEADPDRLRAAMDQWERLKSDHASGIGFLEGMRLLSGATGDHDETDDPAGRWNRIVPGPWLAETLSTLRQPTGEIAIDPEKYLDATLRPYQRQGVGWLWFATQLNLGVCLADDMGLGKTIQVISLLTHLQTSHRPSLLILPTSLLGNWQREVQRFAPQLSMVVAHRSVADADTMKRIAADPTGELAGVDLVATTYGLARRQKWLREVSWNLVILDEAQAIKNAGATQTKAIKQIPSRSRIALTGTPVENHLGDLWSLFDFCAPGLLGTASEFKKFVRSSDERQRMTRMASVRRLIQPYVLRRMKTDPAIVPDLPAKTEMRIDCGLTTLQATLYRQITDDLKHSLEVATGIQRRGMVLSTLMQLKQVCNHPALHLKQSEFESDASGKFAELRDICGTILEKQEKMLVFSQFQSMCGPLAEFLAGVFGREGLVLTGKTTAAARGKLVKQFQEDDGPPFFVISVKAGGVGLNLTQASHVVHFDRWWNPAVEDQATDRAFRIGQKRNVLVHKFVCRGTLEEKIDDMIRGKKELSRELFDGRGDVQITELSDEQLMNFVALDLSKASL